MDREEAIRVLFKCLHCAVSERVLEVQGHDRPKLGHVLVNIWE